MRQAGIPEDKSISDKEPDDEYGEPNGRGDVDSAPPPRPVGVIVHQEHSARSKQPEQNRQNPAHLKARNQHQQSRAFLKFSKK